MNELAKSSQHKLGPQIHVKEENAFFMMCLSIQLARDHQYSESYNSLFHSFTEPSQGRLQL